MTHSNKRAGDTHQNSPTITEVRVAQTPRATMRSVRAADRPYMHAATRRRRVRHYTYTLSVAASAVAAWLHTARRDETHCS